MLIDVGQVVAKKYELVRLLGRGSMGEVWSAHHQALREEVAIKVLAWPPSGEDAEDPAVALERFRFEAQVAARLSRKTRHIARVTDYGEDDGLPYLVMELLDGEALDAALRARGVLPPAEVAQIVSQIARALAQAHAESVAHRDLKPANVFLTRDEEGGLLVKLLDFGIARTIHKQRPQGTFSTAKGFVFGTPGYMSPEQTRASPKLDHRCDLWSLATIAYQMLCGHLPVDGADTEEVMKNLCAGRIVPLRQRSPTLPTSLDTFFERAFADRVDDRFQDATSLAQGFETACGVSRMSLPPPAPSSPDPSSPDTGTGTEFSASVVHELMAPQRRTRARIALIGGGALVGAVLVLAGAWRSFGSTRVPEITPVSAARGEAAPSASTDKPALIAEVPAASAWSPLPPPPPVKSTHAQPAPRANTERPASSLVPVPAATAAHPKVAPDAPLPPRPAHTGGRPAEDRNDVF